MLVSPKHNLRRSRPLRWYSIIRGLFWYASSHSAAVTPCRAICCTLAASQSKFIRTYSVHTIARSVGWGSSGFRPPMGLAFGLFHQIIVEPCRRPHTSGRTNPIIQMSTSRWAASAFSLLPSRFCLLPSHSATLFLTAGYARHPRKGSAHERFRNRSDPDPAGA